MEGCVRLYDVRARSAMQTLAQHGVAALCARWPPGSEYGLWTSGMDGDLVVWDVRTSRPRHTLRYARRAGVLEEAAAAGRWHHSCCVTCLEFGADGRALHTVDEGAVMKSWRVAPEQTSAPPLTDTGVVFPALAQSRIYAEQGLTLDRFAVSTDGTRVYAPTTDGVAAIDTATGQQLVLLAETVSSVVACQFNHRTNVCICWLNPLLCLHLLFHFSASHHERQQMVSLSDCSLVIHDSSAQDFETPEEMLRPDAEPALHDDESNSNSILAATAEAARAAANAQELFGYESLDEDDDYGEGGDNNGNAGDDEDYEVWD